MTFCTVCGKCGSILEIRKHMLQEHYNHVLLRGDKNKLQKWMELKQ